MDSQTDNTIRPDLALLEINNQIAKYFPVINEIIGEIKEESPEDYKDVIENLEKFNFKKLPSELKPYKDVILNISKVIYVLSKNRESKNKMLDELFNLIEDKDKGIQYYEDYIVKLHDKLSKNKVEVPQFEKYTLKNTNVKNLDAIKKRLQLVYKNDSATMKKWIEKQPYNQDVVIPNNILKKSAKEENISMRVQKNEQNTIYKKSENS